MYEKRKHHISTRTTPTIIGKKFENRKHGQHALRRNNRTRESCFSWSFIFYSLVHMKKKVFYTSITTMLLTINLIAKTVLNTKFKPIVRSEKNFYRVYTFKIASISYHRCISFELFQNICHLVFCILYILFVSMYFYFVFNSVY